MSALSLSPHQQKQLALEKILNFKPYKIAQDSVEILREVREDRIQQVID